MMEAKGRLSGRGLRRPESLRPMDGRTVRASGGRIEELKAVEAKSGGRALAERMKSVRPSTYGRTLEAVGGRVLGPNGRDA